MIKKALRFPTIVIFSLIFLYSCVLTPLREYLWADLVLSESIWFVIVDLLWMHLNVVAGAALLTFATFGIYRYRLRGSKQVLLITLLALLFKYVAAILSFSIEYGSLDLTGSLVGFLLNFFIELALICLIVFLACRFVTTRQVRYEAKKEAARKLDRPFEEKPIYPFQRRFSLKNPLQRLFFIGLVAIALSLIIADIPQTFQYGIFGAADIPVAILSWVVLIILPAVYSYFLSLLFFKLCHKQEEPQKKD